MDDFEKEAARLMRQAIIMYAVILVMIALCIAGLLVLIKYLFL